MYGNRHRNDANDILAKKKKVLGEWNLKKRIFIISGIIIFLVVAGLLIAGNYFYSESVKRGKEVELYLDFCS